VTTSDDDSNGNLLQVSVVPVVYWPLLSLTPVHHDAPLVVNTSANCSEKTCGIIRDLGEDDS
jgi:hypothetical protein